MRTFIYACSSEGRGDQGGGSGKYKTMPYALSPSKTEKAGSGGGGGTLRRSKKSTFGTFPRKKKERDVVRIRYVSIFFLGLCLFYLNSTNVL